MEGREGEKVEASLLGEGREVSKRGLSMVLVLTLVLLLLYTTKVGSEGGTKGGFHFEGECVGRGASSL